MLSWSPGVVEDWTENQHYKKWHWNAIYSSGFNKMASGSRNEEKAVSTEFLPSAMQNQKCYALLRALVGTSYEASLTQAVRECTDT